MVVGRTDDGHPVSGTDESVDPGQGHQVSMAAAGNDQMLAHHLLPASSGPPAIVSVQAVLPPDRLIT
jgi:hypothetical protein